jgi:hypothetical protein
MMWLFALSRARKSRARKVQPGNDSSVFDASSETIQTLLQPAVSFFHEASPMKKTQSIKVAMSSDYNDNSDAQGTGGAGTAAKVASYGRLLRRVNPDKTVYTIAEFGCAGGGNSVGPVAALIDEVRGIAEQIVVVMNDREQNDWNVLRRTFQSNFAADFDDGLLSLELAPGSMYTHDHLIPDASVDIAFTNYALNWLSYVPSTFESGIYIHDLPSTSGASKEWAEVQHLDLSNFLKQRSKEMRQGGFLILGIQAREDDAGRAGWQGLSTMGEVKDMMLKEGTLPPSAVNLVDPERNRSMAETLLAVDDALWNVSSIEEKWVDCPFVEQLRKGEASLAECADKSMNLYRACTEHFLMSQLAATDSITKKAAIDAFYARVKHVMMADSSGNKLSTAHPYHYIVLQRK